MAPQDKVEQLRQSIQAQKEADARIKEAEGSDISPGLADKLKKMITELEQTLEEAKAGLEEWKNKATQSHDDFLRKHAELENFRKRMEREKADIHRFGHEKMARELLPVLDSLERAIHHADESHDFKDLMDGVQLVEKQFLQALEKFGIQPLKSEGLPFNPHEHEAVGHLESEEHPPDSVIAEHRRGYKIHDRLLRPAMVSVSKTPEKK
jgi:molecular chaperone GrpE